MTSAAPSAPVCTRCPHALGRSCCEVEPGEALATLTHADVERIASATGQPARAFVEEEGLTDTEAFEYERARPLFTGYFRAGPLRLTLKRRGRACVFHRAGSGCSLSPDSRPLACRLYPFEPLPGGEISLLVERQSEGDVSREGAPRCLAVEEAHSLEGLLVAFSVSPEQLREWADALREASRLHGARLARATSTGARSLSRVR